MAEKLWNSVQFEPQPMYFQSQIQKSETRPYLQGLFALSTTMFS